MSRALTSTQSASITPMNRRNPSTGELFQVMPQIDEYAVPPAGTYGRFKLTGISDVFELQGKWGPYENARLEFEILKVQDPENKYLEGRRFTAKYIWKVRPKDPLAKLLGALRDKPIQLGESVDPDEFIDTEFVTTTTLERSEDGTKSFPDVSVGSIVTSKTALSKWLTAPRQPALVPAGGAEEEIEDPFAVGADDDL